MTREKGEREKDVSHPLVYLWFGLFMCAGQRALRRWMGDDCGALSVTCEGDYCAPPSLPPSLPPPRNTQRLRLTRTYQVIPGQADLSLSLLLLLSASLTQASSPLFFHLAPPPLSLSTLTGPLRFVFKV